MSDKEEIEILEERIRLKELRLKKEKLDQEERDFYRSQDMRFYKFIFNIILVILIFIGIFVLIAWLVTLEDEEEERFNKKSSLISENMREL